MKNLKDIILEKLKIDDIKLTGKFPIDGTVEEIMKFLEGQDFIDISTHHGSVSGIFNDMKKKCVLKFGNRLSFADTSKVKISKDNPVFYVCLVDPVVYSVYYKGNYDNTIDIVENDKEEFLEELNKRFGWE